MNAVQDVLSSCDISSLPEISEVPNFPFLDARYMVIEPGGRFYSIPGHSDKATQNWLCTTLLKSEATGCRICAVAYIGNNLTLCRVDNVDRVVMEFVISWYQLRG